MKQEKWVHIVGICGVATSAIAILFKQLGWKVTGSDKAFFPPISTYLQENSISIMLGYKAKHVQDENGNVPNLVVYQGTKGEQNPEIIFAQAKGLNLKTYPEIAKEFIIKKENSIVVAGTYGKTTITGALIDMFQTAKKEISYLIGGLAVSGKPNAVALSNNTEYSIIEGDEYVVSFTNPVPKFTYYDPTYLILNSISWEHPDVFHSEADYVSAFKELVSKLPKTGLLVANSADKNVIEVCKAAICKVIYYSVDDTKSLIPAEWTLIKESKPLPSIIRKPLKASAEIIPYEKQIIGVFNEENILAATVLAYELGIKKESIQEAIKGFEGIRRRLEIKKQTKDFIVIDDFGSSPPKVKGSLDAVRSDYPKANIICIFEPNTGNRVNTSLQLYKDCFKDADIVIFPRFTRLPKSNIKHFDQQTLAESIRNNKLHNHIYAFNSDEELLKNIKTMFVKGKLNIIVFCGSHSFRKLIPEMQELVVNYE